MTDRETVRTEPTGRTCDGSGWLVYDVDGEAHHDVCYGCPDCDHGWCHEHGFALNICEMDHLEAAEGELVAMVCGEPFNPEAVEFLLAYGSKDRAHPKPVAETEGR